MATPPPVVASLPPLPAPKPPAITDKYLLIRFNDGTSELILATNKRNFCKQFKSQRNDIQSIKKISYADLGNSVTQRVYDYQFYFENFIQTPTTDPATYQQALANLMDLFSNNLYLYVIKGPDGSPIFPPATTKAQVQALQETLHGIFQGSTLHTAPNVRVRPICGNTSVQASTSSGEVDYSRINKGAGPLEYLDVGFYNFTWAYEADNVWRIVTWQIINKLDTVITPATTNPVLFQTYPDNPPSNCTSNQ